MSCINVGSLNVFISEGLDGRYVLDGTITLEGSSGVTQDTNFVITVETDSGSFPLSLQVLSGNTVGNGQYDTGIPISSPEPIQTNLPCISSVNNNEINCSGFTCIGYACPCEDVTPTPTITNTITNTPSQTIQPTVTPTPSITNTQTFTMTPTVSPSLTSSVTITPTNTPTQTPTSTYGTTPPVTPTPSQTPSNTPTKTPTQTPTSTYGTTPPATPSQTPTRTPTRTLPTPYYFYKNTCEPFVLFDLGISCQVIKSPTTYDSLDGALGLIITGGTSPYDIFWDNGQIGKTLYNLKQGSYGVTVVDYYGDYTAKTICNLSAPTSTPTNTPTITPTPSKIASFPNLCMIISYSTQTFGPWQFIQGGYSNGKPKYFAVGQNYTIEWSTTNNRWELKGFTYQNGIIVSTSTSNSPVSLWIEVGASNNPTISVTTGDCPAYLPLKVISSKTDTYCGGDLLCNGSITLIASGGKSPYQYSKDGGFTFQSSSIFANLCSQTYNIVVKDSLNNINSSYVTINDSGSTVSYQLFVENIEIKNVSSNVKQSYWVVKTSPSLSPSTILSFNLIVTTNKLLYEPGGGTILDETKVYKNGTEIYSNTTQTNTTITNRLNCPPYLTEKTGITTNYTVSMTAGDVISGTSFSNLNITNPQIGADPSCVTTLQQQIIVNTLSPALNGCYCCKVVNNQETYGGFTNHILSVGQGVPINQPPPYVVSIAQQPITPNTGAFLGGSITVNSVPVTLKLKSFGGTGFGGSTKGFISIQGIGDYSTPIAYQNQTLETNIIINTTGNFTITSMTGIFVGNSDNKVYLE